MFRDKYLDFVLKEVEYRFLKRPDQKQVNMQDEAYSFDFAGIDHDHALIYRQKASLGCYEWLDSCYQRHCHL